MHDDLNFIVRRSEAVRLSPLQKAKNSANMWDSVKIFITGIFGAIITYLAPIYNPIMILGATFVLDIIFGILVDMIVNDDRIRIKKFLISIVFLAMYFIVIATTFFIGERMDDLDETLYIVKILTYVFAYFYGSNVIRNMRQLAPSSKPLEFLDYFLGLQIIKRLPELAKFLKLSSDKKYNNDDHK